MMVREMDFDRWPFMAGSVLYHGAHGTAEGGRLFDSWSDGDFGSGFYMYGDVLWTKAQVANEARAFMYALEIDVTSLGECKVVELADMDWVYALLHSRRSMQEFVGTTLDVAIGQALSDADIIIGPVGDDLMDAAMKLFEQGKMTDLGLLACLDGIVRDSQVVARTDKACQAVRVITETPVYDGEMRGIERHRREALERAKRITEDICETYRGRGRTIGLLLGDEEEVYRAMEFHEESKTYVFPGGDSWTRIGAKRR